ncbi:MAG: hypothetical protein GY703_24535 [Gammaproteobacteria bacterium]|nr:hypothetical protein [Gammaproteobacteria bacterium]
MPIRVQPNAAIEVDYFHQRDVYSDDPFTPEVEPSQAYSLGVIVKNTGMGTARNLRIDSGQPQIIENEKGLLIDFDIIATRLGNEALSPSLSLNFGDIGPGGVAVGQWLFQSSLQGHFIDYRATFTHIDPLGVLSPLVKEVRIHEMLHPVRALGTLDDGLPDCLVNDEPDGQDLPDILYLSNGETVPVSTTLGGAVFDGTPTPADASIELTLSIGAGHHYTRFPDPANGLYSLLRVIRSDGLELPLDTNVWQTDRTFPGIQQSPIHEHLIHLFDSDSTGRYTLVYDTSDICTDRDRDNDGVTDGDEYRAGTDPTLSGPGVRIRLHAGLNLLAFPGQPAQEHQSCTALQTWLGDTGATATVQRVQGEVLEAAPGKTSNSMRAKATCSNLIRTGNSSFHRQQNVFSPVLSRASTWQGIRFPNPV